MAVLWRFIAEEARFWAYHVNVAEGGAENAGVEKAGVEISGGNRRVENAGV